ncbi:MAG: glycoside hydrolase family 15 protein [Kiloniellales bacterium]
MASLELGVIGNCSIAALIDQMGRVVWYCLPRFDGDPVFCRLLNETDADGDDAHGVYAIEIEGFAESEQAYLSNTAVLVTRLSDAGGGVVEISDFAPRFGQFGRMYRPIMLVRLLRPLAGTPRVRIRLRPSSDYGAARPEITHGSNHVRYVGANVTLRLTTNAPPAYVLDETPFFLEEPIALILGPDETLTRPPMNAASELLERTQGYWGEWVRGLALPLEWQDAVIRAAITTKLCNFEETGAIVAALTTSIPETADSGRNWDYRYCWLRDAFFVVRALNRLGAVPILENYLRYLTNIVATADGGHIQPVYGIALERRLREREVSTLSGYRGMAPVRIGNKAHEQHQHDVYGDVVLATTQAFFDKRLLRPAGPDDFRRLERVGEQAVKLHAQPDASIWERRTQSRIHSSSSVMCWAACDRLAKIAVHLGLGDRADTWRAHADRIRDVILERAWNGRLNSFVDTFEGTEVDASLLLMGEVGFVKPEDPRFVGTMAAIESTLRRKNHLMRYAVPDDLGLPTTSFIICTFWGVEWLAALGRLDEACDIFEELLASRNHLGLLSEDIDVETGELWGNFPQTYSQVGLINCAIRLSRRWETVL